MVITEGSESPNVVKILKVPKSSKVIGICPQALINYFKPNIINKKTNTNAIKMKKKNIVLFALESPYREKYDTKFSGLDLNPDLVSLDIMESQKGLRCFCFVLGLDTTYCTFGFTILHQ